VNKKIVSFKRRMGKLRDDLEKWADETGDITALKMAALLDIIVVSSNRGEIDSLLEYAGRWAVEKELLEKELLEYDDEVNEIEDWLNEG